MPPTPATRGTVSRLRSVSSPTENSRRTSSPTTKKKTTINPSLTQWWRSIVMPWSASRTESSACQRSTYASDHGEFAQSRATSETATRIPALPASVRMNFCRGPRCRTSKSSWTSAADTSSTATPRL